MMAEGRGSAAVVASLAVVVVVVLLHSGLTEAATYAVGDGGGWSFNVAGWPRGKPFRAGDTLVFNYDPSAHNVVAVDRRGYTTCSTPARARVFVTGRDQVRLVRGQNFFICSLPGHCQSGMKIAVTAV